MQKVKQMYGNKTAIAKMFGISTQTVYRKLEGIQKQIGKRYNQYAIIDNLVSVAVFADYYLYEKHLEDKNLSKCVPNFEIEAATRYFDKRGMTWV